MNQNDKKYDNKYHLYFSRWPRQSGHESWISHSEITYAVADKPEGPWRRFEIPVLSNSEDTTAFDAMCVNNPAVCIGRNGKIVMLYKAVCKNGTRGGDPVRFSVAFANSPTGPFVKTNKLIFQPTDPNARMVAEDPYLWYDEKNDKYYAILWIRWDHLIYWLMEWESL